MTTMREFHAALEFSPEEQEAADLLVPGWREMTPAEFGVKAAAAVKAQWRIFAEAQGLTEEMDDDR
jgi:hypothetical protein